MNLIIGADSVFFLEKNLMIPFGENNVGVGAAYLTDSDSGGSDDLRPCIELCLIVVDHDNNMMGLCQFNGFCRDFLIDIFQ